MQRVVSRIRTRKGFTLVELAVVIVIIGVLAAFGVPKFLQSVEKSKASEAFNYLSAIQAARGAVPRPERRLLPARSPTLDIILPAPQYFTVPSTITVTPDSGRQPGLVADAHAQLANSSYALHRQLDAASGSTPRRPRPS